MSTCRERQAKRKAKIKQDKELCQAYPQRDRKRKAARHVTLKSQMSAPQLEKERVNEHLHLYGKYREKEK